MDLNAAAQTIIATGTVVSPAGPRRHRNVDRWKMADPHCAAPHLKWS